MKLGVALATASLALLGATANAQLTFTFTQGPTTGGPFDIFGEIRNTGTTSVTIDQGNPTSPVGVTFVDNFNIDDVDLSQLPLTLGPGDSYSLTNFLGNVVVPGTQAPGVIRYSLFSDAGTLLGEATYNIGVAPSDVPEPGVTALLMGGVAGGAVLLRRRRK